MYGLEWVNVFWFLSAVSADPTRTQMDTFATSILGTYTADFKPLMHAGVTIDRCDAAFWVTGDQVVPGIALNTVAGTRAGTPLTNGTCGVVNWHTNFDHYRGGHARTYIPGPVQNDLNTGATWQNAYKTALGAAATSFLAAVNSYAGAPFTSLQLVMLTRIRDKQPLATPVLRPINSSSVRPIVGSQRRRNT
jgi:hypothetical protein